MVASYHFAATPQKPSSVAINRCNISLDLMLQPMLQPKTTFRPMVVEVFARDVAHARGHTKALSDPPNRRFVAPAGGPMLHTAPPAFGVAQGQSFPPGRGNTAVGKMTHTCPYGSSCGRRSDARSDLDDDLTQPPASATVPATRADAHGLPGRDRIRGQPHGDIASLDQRLVVCRPIPDVVSCLVLRVHSRLHVEIMHLLSPQWPGGRSWLTADAGSVHQRRDMPRLVTALRARDQQLGLGASMEHVA